MPTIVTRIWARCPYCGCLFRRPMSTDEVVTYECGTTVQPDSTLIRDPECLAREAFVAKHHGPHAGSDNDARLLERDQPRRDARDGRPDGRGADRRRRGRTNEGDHIEIEELADDA